MLTRVEAGAEVEHCQFFQVPPGGMNVTRSEARFTAGSHHVLMYLTPYTSIPTKNDRGEAVDTTKVFDCTSGAFDGWSITTMVGGSQNGDGDSPVEFPPGVAMPLAFDAKAADGVTAHIQFQVSGEEPGQYHLRIAGGRCESVEGVAPEPDLTVYTPDAVWARIARGEMDGGKALAEGLYQAEGDLMVLAKMREWFKGVR